MALCRRHKLIESRKRIGQKQQIDVSMGPRRHQLEQLLRPAAENKGREASVVQRPKDTGQKATVIRAVVNLVHVQHQRINLPAAARLR